MVVHEVVRDGEFFPRHIEKLRDAMAAAIDRHFPPGLHWVNPEGGLFMWVTLPPALDADELLKEALGHKVAFARLFLLSRRERAQHAAPQLFLSVAARD
jgi:2-aminoadipate transaminase